MPHIIVIRYCPDVAKGEFANIGVAIVTDGGGFLTAWLEGIRATIAYEFLQCDIFSVISNLREESVSWTCEILIEWAGNHHTLSSVEFFGPTGTIRPPDEALADARRRYLGEIS